MEENSTALGINGIFNMTISEGEFHEFNSGIMRFVFPLSNSPLILRNTLLSLKDLLMFFILIMESEQKIS